MMDFIRAGKFDFLPRYHILYFGDRRSSPKYNIDIFDIGREKEVLLHEHSAEHIKEISDGMQQCLPDDLFCM